MSKAKELVGLIKEIVEEFKVNNLNNFATPDVVQKLATTLFIDGRTGSGGGPAAALPSSGGAIIGTLESKEVKKLPNGGTKYSVKIDGKWYSSFDAKVFGGVKFNEGDEVKATVMQKGKFWNLVKLELADNANDTDGPEIPF